MKIEKRWIISFIIIAVVSVAGLLWPESSATLDASRFLGEDKIVGADVAWILCASGLVLLMTPGLSFFMAVWWVKRILSPPCCRVL